MPIKGGFMKNEFVRVFRAFSDVNRVRILELLCEGEQCACVLLEDIEIGQPTLSHHMKILCASGIVKSRKVGKWNYYSIDEDGCQYGSKLLNAVMERKMDSILRIAKAVYVLPLLRRLMRKHAERVVMNTMNIRHP
jgi:ArsR family transcriptional regulator